MDRYKEIMELVPEDSKKLLVTVVMQMVELETRLDNLKALPFIEVHPKNPMKQRVTPAAKQYKEFMQQYINCVKAIESVIYRDKKLAGVEEEESPLRKWFNAHK